MELKWLKTQPVQFIPLAVIMTCGNETAL